MEHNKQRTIPESQRTLYAAVDKLKAAGIYAEYEPMNGYIFISLQNIGDLMIGDANGFFQADFEPARRNDNWHVDFELPPNVSADLLAAAIAAQVEYLQDNE